MIIHQLIALMMRCSVVFFELMNEGGMIMIPLLICSILVWTVTFERIWFLNTFRKQVELITENATELLKDKKYHEAKGLCHGLHPVVKTPYLALFEKEDLDKEAWEGRVSRRVNESQQNLRRSMWILGTIGSSAPFIGLFGTVVGIIKSFDSIAGSGKSGFNVVAAGLSEALIATAAGIIVAVMALFLYNYFQNKLQQINIEYRGKVEDLMDLF
jgi:biopolymer transport protein ExbB/TolQ